MPPADRPTARPPCPSRLAWVAPRPGCRAQAQARVRAVARPRVPAGHRPGRARAPAVTGSGLNRRGRARAAGRRGAGPPEGGPRSAPGSRSPPRPRPPPVVADHDRLGRARPEDGAGQLEQGGVRLRDAVLEGEQVGVDEPVEPVPVEDRARVPPDVAHHGYPYPALPQSGQHLGGVRVRLPGRRVLVPLVQRLVESRVLQADLAACAKCAARCWLPLRSRTRQPAASWAGTSRGAVPPGWAPTTCNSWRARANSGGARSRPTVSSPARSQRSAGSARKKVPEKSKSVPLAVMAA